MVVTVTSSGAELGACQTHGPGGTLSRQLAPPPNPGTHSPLPLLAAFCFASVPPQRSAILRGRGFSECRNITVATVSPVRRRLYVCRMTDKLRYQFSPMNFKRSLTRILRQRAPFFTEGSFPDASQPSRVRT
jgi:hypothetical protein